MNKISCIVPARNEEGHLQNLIDDILQVDFIDQIIIVEGHSTDNTWQTAEKIQNSNPNKIELFKQPNTGKFDAVRFGAQKAFHDSILIWDADATVSKSDTESMILIHFETRSPVIGNRLIGKMEYGAMRFANKIGNWVFAILWIPIHKKLPFDLLCGTKIFDKKVFLTINEKFLKLDPFGDFALIANALTYKQPITSFRVNYASRKYGKTNIQRWRSGIHLLKFTLYIYQLISRNKFYRKDKF
jgi:glycosyltransferase involved in cell wall biosynthesis